MHSTDKFLIVAGMPCSGKSTLLRRSVEKNISLFGNSNDDVFKQVCVPPSDQENEYTLEERLKNGYWLHERDLIRSKLEDVNLTSCVIHFDLYWYYTSVLFLLLKINKLDPENMELVKGFVQKSDSLHQVFDTVKSRFMPGSRIVIKILKTDYHVVCDRWNRRMTSQGHCIKQQEFLFHYIYNSSIEGMTMYQKFLDSAVKSFSVE